MRIFIFILSFLFSPVVCTGQKRVEQKIADFKNNYLRKAKLNKTDTLRLDSVIIVRHKEKDFRLIKTFYKNRNRTVHESYYDRTTQVESVSEYDSVGRPIGIAKHFTRAGVLEYTHDYDKGEWIVYDTANYPFYNLQKAIKLKADSVISRMYGQTFLQNHITWRPGGSYMSNEKEHQRWTSKIDNAPSKFEFCYEVRLDNQGEYKSYIYFDLDTSGNFLPDYREKGFFFNGYGFEDVPEDKKGAFRINYDQALSRARKLGLIETDSSKAFGSLHWESFRKKNSLNGQFRFYIIIKKDLIKDTSPGGYSATTKYDVYVFNPWTAEFVEMKKMKTKEWRNKDRSGFSLLEPDKDQ